MPGAIWDYYTREEPPEAILEPSVSVSVEVEKVLGVSGEIRREEEEPEPWWKIWDIEIRRAREVHPEPEPWKIYELEIKRRARESAPWLIR